ncbi:unnamed protein product [Ranitomeya imitator]|uniref:Uncharacterized protein n=1 Tax=Ranitomeya imitator TaxID=111125 RepID=A0ABN9M012_9NEOB|nr:unnamed protein product [Ranitomeya imitator]
MTQNYNSSRNVQGLLQFWHLFFLPSEDFPVVGVLVPVVGVLVAVLIVFAVIFLCLRKKRLESRTEDLEMNSQGNYCLAPSTTPGASPAGVIMFMIILQFI